MGHNIVKKSCIRTNKTNYCRVQFIDDDLHDHAGVTPPASPTDYEYRQDKDGLTQSELANEHQAKYEPLYKNEKKKTELLELQIQQLQLQLMDKDRRLAMSNKDDYKYSKLSHLVNEILSISRTDDDNEMDQCSIESANRKPKQYPCTLENIHDRLQDVLLNLMVTQQQQTRLQYNPHDEYQQHITSIYYH